MQRVTAYAIAPGCCFRCGSARISEQAPAVDTLITDVRGGRIYVCSDCVTELGRVHGGLVGAEQLVLAQAEAANLKARLEELEDVNVELAELKAAVGRTLKDGAVVRGGRVALRAPRRGMRGVDV